MQMTSGFAVLATPVHSVFFFNSVGIVVTYSRFLCVLDRLVR